MKQRVSRLLLPAVLLAASVESVSLAPLHPAASASPSATLALSPCHIDGLAEEILCGSHEVFEDRRSGRTIPIHVAVLPSLRRPSEADPLFLMAGGPGQGARGLAPVTGNYTIPLMRKLGYHPNFAGGVESMSSIGGSLSPPIMGIASFIMADLLAVPYIEVMKYAIIPCVLFYTGIIAGIHFEASRIGLAPLPPQDIPRLRDIATWANTAPLIIPVIVLMGLLFADYTLLTSGFYSCLAAIALYVFSSRTGIRERAVATVRALSEGGVAVAQIAPLLIAVAMFTALLGLTGVAAKISAVILEMGGDYLFVSLLIAAIIPLLLGAPLPVAATYILSAALIAPALIRLKLDPAAVHMFLLYWATLASVTPPTCTASVVAARIAGGDWFKTSLVGMRLGIVAFIVPFFFVVNPSLIWKGPALHIVFHAVAGLAGAMFLAGGFFGYVVGHLNWIMRGVYLVAGGLLLAPDRRLVAAGAVLAALALLTEFLLRRRK